MISVHSCVRGKVAVHLLEGPWIRCIHVWGVKIRCIYLRNDDFGAFMCEGQDSGAFTWGMTISVHSCVIVRIPVHLREEWQFRFIHVWGVRFWCNYLKIDDFGVFMFEAEEFGAFTWGVTISVHSCVRGKISVHLLEEWRFRCIHVWGVRFRCIYLREDDFSAFMCEW